MEQQLKSPCMGCTHPCTPPADALPDCEAYRRFINSFWRRCRRWPGRPRPAAPRDCFRYAPPYLVERSLNRGPCPDCIMAPVCGDRESCRSYEQWSSARLRRIRLRLGLPGGKIENSRCTSPGNMVQ